MIRVWKQRRFFKSVKIKLLIALLFLAGLLLVISGIVYAYLPITVSDGAEIWVNSSKSIWLITFGGLTILLAMIVSLFIYPGKM